MTGYAPLSEKNAHHLTTEIENRLIVSISLPLFHNILGSDYSLDNIARGGAFINNLICGTMRREQVLNRATPYHYPYSAVLMSTTFVYGGNDRWFQNIFVGGASVYTEQSRSGTDYYDGHPNSLAEYIERIKEAGNADLEKFEIMPEPVYINNNAYLKGSAAYHREESNLVSSFDPQVKIVVEDGKTVNKFNFFTEQKHREKLLHLL